MQNQTKEKLDEFIAEITGGEIEEVKPIIEGIANLGSEAVGPIVGILRDKENKATKDVRLVLVEALGYIDDPKVVGPLIELLVDEDGDVATYARYALEEIGRKAVQHLVEALKSPNPCMQKAAAIALTEMEIPRDTAIEPFIDLLEKGDFELKKIVLLCFARMKGARVLEALINATQDDNARIREVAVKSMGAFQDKRALETLIPLLHDDGDEFVRGAAARAIGFIGEGKEDLIHALKDEKIHYDVADALSKIGASVLNDIVHLLKNENPVVRKGAVIALQKIKTPGVIEPIIAALRDEYIDVRSAAAYALGEIGDRKALEPLIEALRDEDFFVVSQTVGALRKIGDPMAAEPLIDTLKLKGEYNWLNLRIHFPVIRFLERVPIVNVFMALRLRWRYRFLFTFVKRKVFELPPMTRSQRKIFHLMMLKENIAETLGTLGDPRAIPVLSVMVKDMDDSVRKSASEAIQKIKEKEGQKKTSA